MTHTFTCGTAGGSHHLLDARQPLGSETPAVGPAPVAISRLGTYGIAVVENGQTKIMAPGGATTAWFNGISQVHVFTPPDNCAP